MVNKYVLLTAFVTINQILCAFDGSMKNNTGDSKKHYGIVWMEFPWKKLMTMWNNLMQGRGARYIMDFDG